MNDTRQVSTDGASSPSCVFVDHHVHASMQVVQAKTPFDEEPLFLYLAHQAVHDPIGPAPWGEYRIPGQLFEGLEDLPNLPVHILSSLLLGRTPT